MLDRLFEQATTPGGILAFILGTSTAFVYHKIAKPWWCKRHGIDLDYQVSFRLSNLVLVIMALSVVWTGVKYTELATQVAACQKEFNTALVQRSTVSRENDTLSIEQRLIVFNWMHDLVFPPPPVNEWPANDPRRQLWGINRTIEANEHFKDSIDRQTKLIDSRTPLPDPTCGRE